MQKITLKQRHGSVRFLACALAATTMGLTLCPLQAQSLWQQLFSPDFFSQKIPADKNAMPNIEFHWTETPQSHVLLIAPQGGQDIPLDIKIAQGLVKVSGKVIRQERMEQAGSKTHSSYLSQFSLAESIPQTANPEQAKIEQAKNSIKITFPKKPNQRPLQKTIRPRLKQLKFPGEKI